jgi:hypothetical protein
VDNVLNRKTVGAKMDAVQHFYFLLIVLYTAVLY